MNTLAEVLPKARSLSAADKLRLIGILSAEVAEEPDIAPLVHGRTYVVSTPQFEPGAAAVLMRELQTGAQD